MNAFLDRLVNGKTQSVWIQIFRYLVVSGASLALDFAALWALTELASLHYLASAALSYAAGLVLNYYLSRLWVFHSSKLKSQAAEFSIFALIGVVGLGVNELILWASVGLLGLHYLVGRGVSAIIGYAWKYVARKWLLFR